MSLSFDVGEGVRWKKTCPFKNSLSFKVVYKKMQNYELF